MTAAMPNNGLAVAIDLADPDNPKDIHPKNKQEVGRRLALVALEQTYGKTLVSRGPTLRQATFADDKVTISFDHIGGGLKMVGEHLDAFALAGEDGKWFLAQATFDEAGDKVIVRSDKVSKPAVVRYAWADNPKASLFNADGLPAEPFEARR